MFVAPECKKIKKELSKFWNVYSTLKCVNQVSFITNMQAENLETLAFWRDYIYNLDMNLGVLVNDEICQRNGIRSGWVECIIRISPYDVLRSWRISVVENRYELLLLIHSYLNYCNALVQLFHIDVIMKYDSLDTIIDSKSLLDSVKH